MVGWAAKVVDPAWRAVADGESRWPATFAIGVAIFLQLSLPLQFTIRPWWAIPAIEAAMMVGLIISNPRRIDRYSVPLRWASLSLIGVLTATNSWSALKLVRGLLHGEGHDPTRLLATGAAIWMTNMIAFALWYWEFDRGGPGRRIEDPQRYPDFLFPQMQSPELVRPGWGSSFVDYLYLSFTNATAFSPTDVLPMSRWAKLTMMLQSGISLLTVALVVARAVNILK